MVMSANNGQGVQADSIRKNQLCCDLTNLDNEGASRERKLDMKSMNQNEVINEGVVSVNRKGSRGGVVIKSGNNIKIGKGKDGKYRDSHHEMHIWNEREMGKETRKMFVRLHALLPDLPSKVDKSTIVDATVKQIKNLQQILENLEKKKQEKLKSISSFVSESSSVMSSPLNPVSSSYNNKLPISAIPTSNALSLDAPPRQHVDFQTWSSKNIVLNISGGEAQFCICATKKLGLLAAIAFVLEKYMIDVVSVNIMCNGGGNMYMVQIHASLGSYDSNSMEETYKQAAGEIMTWIS